MANYTGFVDFGSGDSSILAEGSLKTAASITGLGTNSALMTGASIDSSKGVIGTTNGAVKIAVDSLPTSLPTEGQMSFDVTTLAVSVDDATVGSDGYARAETKYHMTNTDADSTSSTPYGRWYQATNQKNNIELNTSDTHFTFDCNQGGTASNHIHSLGKGETVTITISWTYSELFVYVNKVFYGKGSRATAPTAAMFDYIFLGSDRGGSTGDVTDAYYSNFVISSKPVRLASNYNLKKVICFGDSIVSHMAPQGYASLYGNNASIVIESELRKNGFEINLKSYVDGYSGATVYDGGAVNLETTNDRAGMLLTNPDIVIFHGGTNDVIAWSSASATFDTDLKDHMTSILAVADKVIVCTIPTLKAKTATNTAQVVADTAECNALIRALPAWWDAANPSDTNRIFVCDMFTITGGESPQELLFVGDISGDDLHYSAKGQKLLGESIAATLLRAIRA